MIMNSLIPVPPPFCLDLFVWGKVWWIEKATTRGEENRIQGGRKEASSSACNTYPHSCLYFVLCFVFFLFSRDYQALDEM